LVIVRREEEEEEEEEEQEEEEGVIWVKHAKSRRSRLMARHA
jgi:hypothetical protein